jgi:regulator of CtrA degradation
MANELMIESTAINFSERLAASNSFKTLFRDGMALVEETAAYLDGEGRDDAKRLPRLAALSYASESMRLTTRLMQIASWLLLQRAVNEGEITQTEASSDNRRTRISWQQPLPADLSNVLPARLVTLIEGSMRLQERISRLDTLISAPRPLADKIAADRPLEQQLSRLRDAFCN